MNIYSRQLEDEQQPNIKQLQAQLKECHLDSAKQFLSSSRKLKSLTLKNIRNKKVTQSMGRMRNLNRYISTTEEPLSSSQSYSTNQEESASDIVISNQGSISQISRGITTRAPILRRRKKKYIELKDVIMNQKVNGLKELFCNKLRRNNSFSKPVDYNAEEDTYEQSFMNSSGIELNQTSQKLMSLFSIFNIISSIFIFTMSIVFAEISDVLAIEILELFGAIIFLLQLVLNFLTVRFSLGRKLENIKQISNDYFKGKFAIDGVNFIILVIYLLTQNQIISHFRMIVLFKLPDCMDKLEKLQVYFIENYYNEQYWSLVKVLLFNFCIAHTLAVLLIGMSSVNPSNNWLIQKNLIGAPWYEQYIWAYYWGTTIMLTIGFGDILPACYQEALCMIFIETISCIVLAYNINCVGSLISNIRSQDIFKSKNMKIFKKLVDKNNISDSLSWRINNYLEEHTNIKKLFNIQQESQFVQRLPSSFRTDYLKQANKAIFQKVFFFNQLMEKTLFSLAEKIEMKITHPQEVILNAQRNFDVFILKNGEIGYIPKKGNKKISKYIFDRKKVQENSAPFLLNANFITKSNSNFAIKSIVYSVLYYLEYDKLIEIFKESHSDYQMYCKQRDKNKHIIDEFEVFPCEFCPHQKHSKFLCPKLHFMPLIQHIVFRYLFREKQDKNSRITSFDRIQVPRQSSLARFLFNKEIYDEKKNQSAFSALSQKNKSKEFFIQQLQSVENEGFEDHPDQSKGISLQAMTKLQYNFLQNTTQTIRNQINKALGVEKGEDDIWLLDLDRMKNYKSYFTENNPCNLHQAFNYEGRLKKVAENRVYDKITSIFDRNMENMMSNYDVEEIISKHAHEMLRK